MTVDHLKTLHSKGFADLAYDPHRFAMDYHTIGFRECATEVARYLASVEGMDVQDPLRLRLMSHLQMFAAQRINTSPLTAPPAPATTMAGSYHSGGSYHHHHHQEISKGYESLSKSPQVAADTTTASPSGTAFDYFTPPSSAPTPPHSSSPATPPRTTPTTTTTSTSLSSNSHQYTPPSAVSSFTPSPPLLQNGHHQHHPHHHHFSGYDYATASSSSMIGTHPGHLPPSAALKQSQQHQQQQSQPQPPYRPWGAEMAC